MNKKDIVRLEPQEREQLEKLVATGVLVRRSLRRARLRITPCHASCYDSFQLSLEAL